MTDSEQTPIEGTKTHPYIAKVIIDPAMWAQFERAFENRPEVRIRKVDHQTPDAWNVYVACASEEVRRLLERGW